MVTVTISDNDRILIVAPHPDDESIGAGGLIMMYPELCDIWLLTDGRFGTQGVDPQQVLNERKKEFIEAMEYAGVNSYKMYGIEDGTLSENMHMLDDIDLSKYTKIFVTNGDDNHIDHRSAFYIVINALEKQNILNAELYQYEITEPLNHATHMLNITDVIYQKKELIKHHKSQMTPLNYAALAESINSYRANVELKQNSYCESYLLTDRSKINDIISRSFTETRLQKHILLCKLQDIWLSNAIKKKSAADVLISKKFNNIAIYGFGKLGKNLCNDLIQDGRVEIKYIIDQAIENNEFNIKMVKLNSNMEKTDIIIVTAVYEYESILNELKALGYDNVISLEEVIMLM